MKLFAIYVGGELPRANIEVHDMRFVVAASLQDTYEELRRQWWGTPSKLHIDCWAELNRVDGYDVSLRSEPFSGGERLYYVNLGGYDLNEFSEQHRNMFVVAPSIAEAKGRALKSVKHWNSPHRDDFYEAEQAFCLHEALIGHRLHLHLTPNVDGENFAFTCKYIPLKRVRTGEMQQVTL